MVGRRLGWAAIAGSLVTLSLGEWYAGKYLTLGLGLRAVGAATIGAGIAYSFCNDAMCSSDFGHALIGVGVVAAAAGIGYDIATTRSAARDYNANHRVAIMRGAALAVGARGRRRRRRRVLAKVVELVGLIDKAIELKGHTASR